MLINIKPRISKPAFGSVQVDWAHPLAQGLVRCYLCNEGAGLPKNLVRAQATTGTGTTLGFSTNAAGLAAIQDDNISYWSIGTDDLPTASVTVAIIKRNRNTDELAATGGISNRLTTGASEFGIYIPYSDGVIYWDFGGSASPNRINWTYGTKTQGIEHHVFVAGRKGSAIYYNGTLKASQGTAISRTLSGNTVDLGRAPDGGVRPQDLNLVLVYNREWSASDVLWWQFEPYAFLNPIPAVRYWSTPPAAAAAAGSVVSPRSLALLGVGS